jgi:hypothetical protein
MIPFYHHPLRRRVGLRPAARSTNRQFGPLLVLPKVGLFSEAAALYAGPPLQLEVGPIFAAGDIVRIR